MKKILAVCVLAASMALAACAADKPQETVTAEAAKDSVKADWFELDSEGKVLTVRLESNPSTGYSWSYEIPEGEILELVTEELQMPSESEGFAGAAGTWCAGFRPAFGKDGDVRLILKYGRPWEDQPLFIKTLSLTVKAEKITVNDFSEMEKNLPVLPDGEYRVELQADRVTKDGDTIIAEMTEMRPVVLSDEEVKALKPGDVIDLSVYALSPMKVERLDNRGTYSIGINDGATLTKDGSLGGWKIVVEDDDVISYPVTLGQATFDGDTVFTDDLSKIAYGDSGKFGNIYDCVQNYRWINAIVTMENGRAKEVKVLYHP